MKISALSRLTTLGLALMLALSWSQLAQAQSKKELEASARVFVEGSVDKLLTTIKTESPYYKEDPERFANAVGGVLREVLDLNLTARFIMGKHGRHASEEQRKKFTEVFADQLLNDYSTAIAEFDFKSIDIKNVAAKPGKKGGGSAIVTMNVITSAADADILYQLRMSSKGEWRVYNMIS